MLNFDILEKGLGIVSPLYFVFDFFKKNVSHVLSYKLTKFHYLIALSSWDIGQYVYCSCQKLCYTWQCAFKFIHCHVRLPIIKFKSLFIVFRANSDLKLNICTSSDYFMHCMKSVQIRRFFWSEYRKIRNRKNSVFGHFSRSANVQLKIKCQKKITLSICCDEKIVCNTF